MGVCACVPLQSCSRDAVLVDVFMPLMNGVDAAEQIKRDFQLLKCYF